VPWFFTAVERPLSNSFVLSTLMSIVPSEMAPDEERLKDETILASAWTPSLGAATCVDVTER
jgi:hypothetical protein